MSRTRRLQVVRSTRAAGRPREVFRKPRRPSRPRRILEALALMGGGVGLLVLLLQLPRLIDLNSLLLVSTALANLIGGLTDLFLGLLQLLAVLLLVGLALLALVLLLGGTVRLVRAVLAPGPRPVIKPGSPAVGKGGRRS